ncbi:hypothetical protein B566_EDAN014453 [Ephemera danica]|nr:hypothetical protein B566_EDAN014453 [Ephemera danica]
MLSRLHFDIFQQVRLIPNGAPVSLGHSAGAEIEPFKIPINRTVMRAITISQGLATKEILIHVIDFTLNHISLNVNGRLVSPSSLAPDFFRADYIKNCNTTFSGTGPANENDDPCVNYTHYPNCACAYFFDLTASLSGNEGHWSARFEIKFKKALTEQSHLHHLLRVLEFNSD